MTGVRRPIVEVIGPSGRNLVPLWGAALIGVQITDQAGYESDSCTLSFRATPPGWSAPAKGTKYTVKVGWSSAGMAMTGIYTSQTVRFYGDPDTGTVMEVVCRAADFVDKLKETDSGHYADATIKEIVDDVAGKMGVSAVVASEIASIKLPYRLRFNQSAGDFLTRLADDVGAVIKPQAGKVVVLKRGSGKSAGGSSLPAITVTYDPLYEFEVEIEPRAAYKEVRGGWIDPKTGLRKTAKASGDGAASTEVMHPYASEDDAAAGVDSAAREQQQRTVSATFTMPGNPAAVAEAPVTASGYGADIDGVAWIANSVTHDIVPDSGWVTTLECSDKPASDGSDKSGSTGDDAIDDPESDL